MTGFVYNITFNQNGKITDYQKSYNRDNSKIVNIFLPLNYNNKKEYNAILSVAINNTFPRKIVYAEGFKSLTDLNKYTFDITQLYLQEKDKRLGLCEIRLTTDNNRTKFKSESFRL